MKLRFPDGFSKRYSFVSDTDMSLMTISS